MTREPFPVDVLPDPIRRFVAVGANAIGCDPSYVALPLLSVCAAAIGNTRRLELKRGWDAPAILWAAIVGESGTAKTPAFKLAMKPLRQRQRKAIDRHAEALAEYETAIAWYEKRFAEWRKDKKAIDDPPEKPEEPQAERCIVSDTTVEALAPLLLANPRGLLLARDELAGWIGSFDRYAGKGGGDAPQWLSMFNAETIIVDRKSSNKTLAIPAASVCICGGIQPEVLKRALGSEHRESGLAARLLLACPPRKAKRWTEADVDPEAEAIIAALVDRLFDFEPAANEDGESCPVVLQLTADAKETWKRYYNAHAREQNELTGDLAAAWSKLEEYAARLALLMHCIRVAADDATLISAETVDSKSMGAGIALAMWFKQEALRVYSLFVESDDEREQRRLLEWLERRGGSATARDVQRGCRWLAETGAAEEALCELVKAGLGAWRASPATDRGGRPSRVFTLSTVSTDDKTPANTDKNRRFVDVDSIDGGKNGSASNYPHA